MKLDLRDQIVTSNQVILSYFLLKLLFCYLRRSSGEVCCRTVLTVVQEGSGYIPVRTALISVGVSKTWLLVSK